MGVREGGTHSYHTGDKDEMLTKQYKILKIFEIYWSILQMNTDSGNLNKNNRTYGEHVIIK